MKTFEFYKQHDKYMAWQDEKREIALKYGFLSISQCYEWMYLVHHKNLSEIAEIFNTSKHCIGVKLRKMGVEMRGKGGPRNHRGFKRDDIIHIRNSKAETKYLAEHYNCSSATINNIRAERHWSDSSSLR